jgi:hypothetical protein
MPLPVAEATLVDESEVSTTFRVWLAVTSVCRL